ncbi:hypothetical protein [Oceanithermus desulfurans]|uniref:Uncharacterized protein n=1 Tax=Oceanithermus desulfurans TaxID=227924 RepID=A0ABR6P3B1_9DEIN|nr:hypothetical protein [Oceanithermus desulfurans]MBB6030501.1 hypothetical protein [Oceanithermus desulfurans]
MAFFAEAREVPIRPLLESLEFIRDVRRWGYAFRFGYLKIGRGDLGRTARTMLGAHPSL